MNIHELKAMPKEEAFIYLVSALDELEGCPGGESQEKMLLHYWSVLEELHSVKVSAIDAWGFFDKKHGTNIADGLRAMAARLAGGVR